MTHMDAAGITTISSEIRFHVPSDRERGLKKSLPWRRPHHLGIMTAFWILLLLANAESVPFILGQQSIPYPGSQLGHQLPKDLHQELSTKLAALERFRSVGNRSREAETVQSIGWIYSNLGKKKEALQYYDQALLLWRAIPNQPREASVLNDLGELYSDLGQKQKALDCYSQAMMLWKTLKDQQGESITLNNIGEVYSSLGETDKALKYYKDALLLQRTLADPEGEAITLNNIGAIYSAIGDKENALDYYNQGLAVLRAISDHEGEAMILNNIALATSDLGENQRALEYYNQVLSLEKTAGNLAGEAKTRNNMAEIYSRTGHKQKALEEYNRALSLLHSAGDAVGEGRILNNIGWLHEDLGAMQMSLNYYQQALPLLHSVSPADEATTLTNIGTIYANLGEQEKGLEYYSQALPLLLSSGDQVGRALTLNNIGTSYSNLGKKDKALEYYDQALVLERAIGDRGKEAITLENVAGLQDAKEDWAAAEENYERALALSASVTDQLTEAGILAALMYHWDEVGNIPFAIFFGKQSVNVYQHIRGNLQGLDKQLQRSFTTSVSGSYRKLADLLVVEGRLPEALDVIDLLKEQEYSEFTRATAAPRTRPLLQTPSEQAAAANIKALIDRFTAVNNKSADLAHKSSRTPPEEIRLAELTSQESLVSGELSKVVYALNRTFVPDNKDQDIAQAELLNSPEAATWEKLVPEGAMALYTLVAASHYRIVIVTPATIFARSYNIGRDEVRRKVKEFSKALRDPNSNPLPSAQALYKVVVAPVEADLKANNPHTLIWSLDDLLRYIPISALHDGQHYMVEHYAIDVTTLGGSIEDIHLLDAAHVRGAAMGISEKYEGFEALPAVAGELNSVVLDPAVERSHGVIPGIIKLNNQFTEAALTEELQQGFGVVHIASHFYAYPTDDTRSYLLLAGKDTAGTAYHLTLAAMREDARIRFDGVALLVLSACETALGGTTPDGREVDGLGTVAQKKGAITVLASLWSVEDASTARLMGIFYDRWIRGGLAKAEALRQAQLELLLGKTTESEVRIQVNTGKASKVKKPVRVSMVETYSHPYYWAPFILMGNWR